MPNNSSNSRPDEVVELPVLWLDDEVILPGMVAPIALDAGTQAAVDAARNAADSRLLIVPRTDGAYSSLRHFSSCLRTPPTGWGNLTEMPAWSVRSKW